MKIVLALVLVCVGTFASRADYLWTWHGDQNYFQASFKVTDPEMLPNSQFISPLFTNSISVSSLDGLAYFGTNSSSILNIGFTPPLHGTIILFDQSTLSRLSITVVPGQATSIHEDSPLPLGQNGESGFWTYDRIVPEPSSPALFAIGAIACAIKMSRG